MRLLFVFSGFEVDATRKNKGLIKPCMWREMKKEEK